MCSRYTITSDIETISERFSIAKEEYYRPRYNAAPTHLLPVITADNSNKISFFYWGIIPEWSKSKTISSKLYNAFSVDIPNKPSLKNDLNKRRCIVPADGFYVWKRISKKGKAPYRFTLASKETFSFAGLWEEFENDQDETVHTFTIITTVANSVVSGFEDFMPVIFDKEKEKIWLSNDAKQDELLDLLTPVLTEQLSHYSVSPEVNDITKDVPSLITPSTPADQYGNYSLFD